VTKYLCGATIDGPKIDPRGNVAWRNNCKVPVSGQFERCRFHGKPCPICGEPMHDAPGYSHVQFRHANP
jgi:hypothetical protein